METVLARIDVRFPAHWDRATIDAYLEAAFGRFGEGVVSVELNPLEIVGFGETISSVLSDSLRVLKLRPAIYDRLTNPTRYSSALRAYAPDEDRVIRTVGDLVCRYPEDIIAYSGIGKTYLSEIRTALAAHGLALQGETPPSES